MKASAANCFSATIEIIGINPFVFVPENVLHELFAQAGKDKGKIPVRMKIDGHEFIQTLIKYSGHWRLYLNAPMRKMADKEVGTTAEFEIRFDPESRKLPIPAELLKAFETQPAARKVFDALPPSRQLEILKYLSFLKTPQSLERNIQRTLNFLLGKERFIGRDQP